MLAFGVVNYLIGIFTTKFVSCCWNIFFISKQKLISQTVNICWLYKYLRPSQLQMWVSFGASSYKLGIVELLPVLGKILPILNKSFKSCHILSIGLKNRSVWILVLVSKAPRGAFSVCLGFDRHDERWTFAIEDWNRFFIVFDYFPAKKKHPHITMLYYRDNALRVISNIFDTHIVLH